MRGRIVTTHLHDNHGEKDEHLLPGEGTIDWDAAVKTLRAIPEELPLVLELKEKAAGDPSLDKCARRLTSLRKSRKKPRRIARKIGKYEPRIDSYRR